MTTKFFPKPRNAGGHCYKDSECPALTKCYLRQSYKQGQGWCLKLNPRKDQKITNTGRNYGNWGVHRKTDIECLNDEDCPHLTHCYLHNADINGKG